MAESHNPENSSESSNPAIELCSLLNLQVDQYKQAERLEEELAELIKSEKFNKIAENTRRKAELMQKTAETNEQIVALARPHQADDGAFSDAKAEALRGEAISLLERLQKLEEENRSALEGFRESRLNNFRQAKQAKRAAHGYKQTKSIYRSKHDTRR